MSVEAGLCAEGSSVTERESVAVGESQSGSVMSVKEGMEEEEDRLSEVSNIGSSQFSGQRLYTVEQIKSFIDETKGRPVNVTDFFPDPDKFICSVLRAQKNVTYDVLSQQKRFRLKKHITAIRKAKSVKSGVKPCTDRTNV